MTTDLAAELRLALDSIDNGRTDLGYERLQRLAEHVERLTADTTEHRDPDEWVLVQRKQLTTATTVTGELDVTAAGLDPDQEIRARALTLAAGLLEEAGSAPTVRNLISYAAVLAAYVRTGERP